MAVWIGSPNFNRGRAGRAIDRIVIHYIVGTVASADAVFRNPRSQVSAHLAIGEGKVHQYVSEFDTAWHAGNLEMNRRSIGIEHSADPNRPPDQWTYDQSIRACIAFCRKYRMNPRTQIIGHNQVKATQCPGSVDLQRIINGVAAGL